MKRYNDTILKIVGLAMVLILTFSACDQWIDTDINIDPDAPADVPMNLIIPGIQQSMGYNLVGNDLVRTTSIWTQQFDGVERQSYTEARYQLLPADVNNVWNTIYPEIFMNASVLIDKAENTEGSVSPHNAGVGKVMVATALGIATDVWGDMPFSEGLKGNQNILTPAFDTQEEIYDTINVMLDAAISDFGSSENAVAVGGDVVYDGDIDKWKKAAYSIKARHALQLSGVNGNAAYSAALAAAANGFTSIADDYEVPWDADNNNPIFQFMEQRTDIRMGATLVNMMEAQEDPRLPYYVAEDEEGNLTGCVIGSQNANASQPGDYVAAQDASSVLMSYSELKFIEAEAQFQSSQPAAALVAFKEAIKASVTKVTGEFDEDWYNAQFGSVQLSLEVIINQKYIATFGTTQNYADYGRTGYPALTAHPDAVISAIPTRYPYAQNELDYNGDNVPSVTISDKLWWDN